MFDNILGVETDVDNLKMDVKSLPKMETKPLHRGDSPAGPTIKAKWVEERLSTDEKPPHRITIKLMCGKVLGADQVEESLQKIPSLQEATEKGLPTVYSQKFESRNPEGQYLIVEDLTLIKAAQLATLKILDILPQNQKAEYVTKMYMI